MRPLPPFVTDLLVAVDAPALLAAHLRLVHDVAADLTTWLQATLPMVEFDAELVAIGAATHDIGKARHLDELHGAGCRHELAGQQMLRAMGVDAASARFAVTHNAWVDPDVALEDLLVALADKIWKARRDEELEQRLVVLLADRAGLTLWEVFAMLDEELQRLSRAADRRLAFQTMWSALPG